MRGVRGASEVRVVILSVVILFHLTLTIYGVPWTIFASQTTPPSDWEWTYFMQV